MSARKTVFETTYAGLPLSETIKGESGFYQDILDAIRHNMDKALKTHSQVLFMLFTFSYPSNGHENQLDNIMLPDAVLPDGNGVFCYFLNQYVRALNSCGYDVRYLWCREQTEGSDRCHYHLALWLDRNEIQYFGSMGQIDGYWSQALANFGIVAQGADTAGLIDRGRYVENGKTHYLGMTVHRGNAQEYNEVFRRASYLAKAFSKTGYPARTRSWGCSERNNGGN